MVEFKRFGENTLTTFFSDSLEKKSTILPIPDLRILYFIFYTETKNQNSGLGKIVDF